MPLFNIIIPIYAYSNIHNVSWASRSDSLDKNIQNSDLPILTPQEPQKVNNSKMDLKRIRLYIIVFWIISNIVVSLVIMNLRKLQFENYLFGIGALSVVYQIIKLIMMVIYRIKIGVLNIKAKDYVIKYPTKNKEEI